MKLMYSPASPYVRKVMMTAHETGLVDRIELVPASTTPSEPNPDLAKLNPIAKIPTLVTDDGLAVFDSRVICRYLDDVAGAGLYGSGADHWAILARESMAEGIIDAALLIVYEGRVRAEDMRSESWVEAQTGKIRRAIAAANARVAEFAGDKVTADQIALAAALGYVDFRLGHLGWRDGNADLAAWLEAFSARPSYAATKPQ